MARRATTARVEIETVWPDAAPFRMGMMGDRVGLLLRLAQSQVFRGISDAFAPFEITPLQFSILALIEANPGCRQATLGAALTIKQPNLVQRIDNLVARGLICRAQDPSDRRANTLALTDKGRKLLAEMKVIDEQVSQGFVERLGPADHAVLIGLLKRLARGDRNPS